jgi:hypothetical protein
MSDDDQVAGGAHSTIATTPCRALVVEVSW